MNRIYWSEDKITMLTDHLDASLAEQLNKKMKEKDYLFLEGPEIDGLQNQAAFFAVRFLQL